MFGPSDLYPNPQVGCAVQEYAAAHSTELPLHILNHGDASVAWCSIYGANPKMMTSPLQAQFMIVLAKVLSVRRVLEIGCFTGYSSISWAYALKDEPNAEIVTLDLAGKSSDFAQQAFKDFGLCKRVTLVQGSALETLTTISGQFDLIFVDANKDGYVAYLDKVLELNLLAPKGLILADNVLRCGLVADRTANNPQSTNETAVFQALELDKFNKFVKGHPQLENFLLPAFDGINFIRLKHSPDN